MLTMLTLLTAVCVLCVSVSWCPCCWSWSGWSSVEDQGFDSPPVDWTQDRLPAVCWSPRPASPVCPACWGRRGRKQKRRKMLMEVKAEVREDKLSLSPSALWPLTSQVTGLLQTFKVLLFKKKKKICFSCTRNKSSNCWRLGATKLLIFRFMSRKVKSAPPEHMRCLCSVSRKWCQCFFNDKVKYFFYIFYPWWMWKIRVCRRQSGCCCRLDLKLNP